MNFRGGVMDKEIIYKIAKMINDGKTCEHEFNIEQKISQKRPHRICSKCGLEKETQPGYMTYPEDR